MLLLCRNLNYSDKNGKNDIDIKCEAHFGLS